MVRFALEVVAKCRRARIRAGPRRRIRESGNEKGQYEQGQKERDAAFITLSHN
jgi:hypothetical protein